MRPKARVDKSRALKDYDAPTLDWIETQEFPVRPLFWTANPIRLSLAERVEDLGSFEDVDDASSTLHLTEIRL